MARKTRRAGRGIIGALLASCAVLLSGQAQADLPQFEQPGWTALTPEQKTILAPLEKEWAQMDAFRRKKWIGIAQRFPDMMPLEQASMQRNMREWAKLAPEERRIAREKYKSLKRISPEQRQLVKQKWEEYSTLTEEEKERLRSKAPKQPKVKTPAKPPAATAPDRRVATPTVPAPSSPISPRKTPQSPLAPLAPEAPKPPPASEPPVHPSPDQPYRG
jgi:hypothetical protein